MSIPQATQETRRDQALRDLMELDQQVQAGEIDAADAEDLRRVYRAEAAGAQRRITELDAPPQTDQAAGPPKRTGRRRLAIGGAVAVVAVITAAMMLPAYLDQRPDGGFVTGNLADPDSDPGQGRDLEQVSNEEMEAVVAANPDVVGMRLRLAHRYLDDGDLSTAIGHYMEVLDRQDDPQAMAHAGWLLFLSQEFGLAEGMLNASLELVSDDPEALWFMANLQLYGTDDPAAAVDTLERLQRTGTLGEEAAMVDQTLAEARRAAAAREGE